MTTGTKIALWVGIPLTIAGGAYAFIRYKNSKKTLKLLTYNKKANYAQIEVGGKYFLIKIEKGSPLKLPNSDYSLTPLFGNDTDVSTLYAIALTNQNNDIINKVDLRVN